MIKVLQIMSSLKNAGGVQSVVRNYYYNMDTENIKFDFVVHSCDESEFKNALESWGCRIFCVTPQRVNIFRYIKEVNKIIKEGNYGIVHNHQHFRGVISLYLAKKNKVPNRIAHCHIVATTENHISKTIRYILIKLLKRFATHWFACGIMAGKWLYGEKAYNNGKVQIMNNAIDTKKFGYNETTRNEVRKALNLVGKTVIGNVARFTYQKNHEFLLKVFAQIYYKNKDALLLLVGDGELEKDVRKQVSDFDIDNAVIFLGARNDVNELMQAMDVFLLPSRFEGLPVVLVEAQCTGLKCIVSDKITEEINVTNNITYVPLDYPPEKWAEIVLNNIHYVRTNNSDLVRANGYDIYYEAKKLENLYNTMVQETSFK